MNILIASDSYKGSLSSIEAAKHIKAGVQRVFPDACFQIVPVADGGEGTVSALVSSLGGSYETVTVTGPMGSPTEARFGILNRGQAVLEMSAASGLTLVPADQRDICKATTFGTGQMIKRALDLGCRQIYIGIGGSATNDGGIGMAQALGAHFLDRHGNEVGLGGGVLQSICSMDLSQMDSRCKETKFTVMSDVDNPLCGPMGASAVYGPQKGGDLQQIQFLDQGLKHLADVMAASGLPDLRDMPGAGAAGGLGLGLAVLTGAVLCSGIEAVLEAAGFEQWLEWADLVITGEGRIDEQSAWGKVPTGVSKCASRYHVPVIAIAGCIGTGASVVYHHGISALESCVCTPCSLDEAISRAAANLEEAAERIMRAVSVGMSLDRG